MNLPRTLPRGLRLWTLLAAAGFFLATLAWGSAPETALDAAISAPLLPLAGEGAWWRAIVSLAGEPGAGGVLLVSLLPYCLRAWRLSHPVWRLVGVLIAALLLALLAAWSVEEWWKPLLGREINGGLAFPSGHATAVSCCGMLAWWGARTLSAPPRRAVRLAALLLVITQSLALVVLGYHYPTDVAGGLLWGGLLAGLAALGCERLTASPRDEAAAAMRRPRVRRSQLAGVLAGALARESLR